MTAADTKTNHSSENGKDENQEIPTSQDGSRRTSGKHRGDLTNDSVSSISEQNKKTQLGNSPLDLEADAISDVRSLEKSRRRRHLSPNSKIGKDTSPWQAENSSREKEKTRSKEANTRGSAGGRKAHLDEEREPAWMQTYDPEKEGRLAGALGGDPSSEGVDGIQAWKQELRAKEKESQAAESVLASHVVDVSEQRPISEQGLENGRSEARDAVDEIAMFKMMMQREQLRSEDEGGLSRIPGGSLSVSLPQIREAFPVQGSEVHHSLHGGQDTIGMSSYLSL